MARLCVRLSDMCVYSVWGMETVRIKPIVHLFLTPPTGLGLAGEHSQAMQYMYWLIAMRSNPVGFLPPCVTLSQTFLLSGHQLPSSTKPLGQCQD